MKKIRSLLFMCFAFVTAKAQSVAINTTGATANGAAILDVSSTTKGILIPRMSSVQRTAIATPANGLLVYDTDSTAFSYFKAGNWVFIKTGRDTAFAWSTKGNANTTTANFIGTTDDKDVYFKRNNINAGYLGIFNTAFGENTGATGAFNTAFGIDALSKNLNSLYNTAIGYSALGDNTLGRDNTAIGFGALNLNSTGSFNNVFGSQAMYGNTTGWFNVAMGFNALFSNTTGYYNTAIGDSALAANRTGTNNVAIGARAGGSSAANDNGFYNTYIGDSTTMLADRTNSTVIGSKAYASANNSMVLGSINGVNGATADVKVGIGVTDPSEKLEIGNGRLRFRGNIPGGNAHGITWTNNAGTTDRGFIGMETDDFFGVYNFGLGWNVRTHNTSGEVGIFKQPLTGSDDSRLQVKQRGSQNGIGIENASTTNHWDIYLDNGAAPNFNFYYNGTLKSYIRNSDGVYIQVSDKNLKKDITPLQSSLQKINSLLPYQYHYVQNTDADNYSIGFMAQDVQKIFPDAVSEKVMKDGKTQLGINYQYFTVLAIKGLQEQQANAEAQNARIEVLENQIAELKKLVEVSLKK